MAKRSMYAASSVAHIQQSVTINNQGLFGDAKPSLGPTFLFRKPSIKASSFPRLIHSYVGSQDVNMTKEEVAMFVYKVDFVIELHLNELNFTSRFFDLRCIFAHISKCIGSEKVLFAEQWFKEVMIIHAVGTALACSHSLVTYASL